MADFAIQNDIYIGSVENPIYHYDNARISGSPEGVFSMDPIGNQLSVDTFTITIKYDPYGADMLVLGVKSDTDPWDGEYLAVLSAEKTTPPTESAALLVVSQTSPANYLSDVPYGTPVFWYVDGAYFAKGYLKKVERVAQNAWTLTCVSGVGRLDTINHKGGLYTGQTFQTIAASIIGDTFAYGFRDTAVRDAQVYGHLPYAKARENLHRLLFAIGANMFKGALPNDYGFGWLGNTIIAIPPGRVSINGSVALQLPATKAEVTEHGFFATADDEIVTLFDNTASGSAAADHRLVVFSQSPVHDLTATGTLTINESNCNYAVVTGIGVLTGKLYQHTQQIVTLEDNQDGNPERVVSVTDNELVSAVNSRNVARRILNYYKSTKTVKGKMTLQSEKPGDLIQSTDAFGDPVQGYISKATITPTSVKGASVEIVDGFIADAQGNNFTKRELITVSGSWVASSTGPIRLVIIQGGAGAQGGYDGQAGMGGVQTIPPTPGASMDVSYFNLNYENPSRWPDRALYYTVAQASKAGGAAGAGGAPGKVLVIDVDVTAGDVISFTIGSGGKGGDPNGGSGTAGTHTTVTVNGTTYTSADGSTNGYYDPISKTAYGIPGKRGHKGGSGGKSGLYDGCEGGDGLSGGTVAGFLGGPGGAGTGTAGAHYPDGSGLEAYTYLANGSGGGGAAYGNSGGAGGTFSIEDWIVDGVFYGVQITGARGGDGGDALAPEKASYGNGGDGGNGGGSGGNASGVYCHRAYWIYNGYAMIPGGVVSSANAHGGTAGAGSKGGDGGDGCLMIYS